MKVLLVDDDRIVRQALSMAFEGMGVDVLCAVNGEEALTLVRKHSFDLVFSDINMPVMDGFEFGRRLRQEPAGRDLPLVFLTGSHPGNLDEEIGKLKAEGLLRKPIGFGELRAFVRRYEKAA